MNPALIKLLISFAPALLSKLSGDPQKKLRKLIAQLTGPANTAKLTNQFYQQALASPAYAQAQSTIGAGANASAADVARHLGASGISGSGSGAILSSLTPSLVGSQMAGLRTGAYGAAQGQANQAIQAQLAGLGGSLPPSQTQQYLAGGLEAFGPTLEKLLAGLGGPPPGAPPSAVFPQGPVYHGSGYLPGQQAPRYQPQYSG